MDFVKLPIIQFNNILCHSPTLASIFTVELNDKLIHKKLIIDQWITSFKWTTKIWWTDFHLKVHGSMMHTNTCICLLIKSTKIPRKKICQQMKYKKSEYLSINFSFWEHSFYPRFYLFTYRYLQNYLVSLYTPSKTKRSPLATISWLMKLFVGKVF